MTKLLAKAVALAAVFLSAGSVLASTTMITESYVLGEGDSKLSAREAIMSKIKLKAADQAGSYVEHDELLSTEGALSQKIRILTAAMVKAVPIMERLTVNSFGSASMEITASVTVDEGELKNRIVALQSDAKRDETITALQTANHQLHAKLDDVWHKLHSSELDLSQESTLVTRQYELNRDIEKNEQAVRRAFETGELMRMAISSTEDAAALKLQFTKHYLDTWAQLSTTLRPRVLSAHQVGDKVEIIIAVPGLPMKYSAADKILETTIEPTATHKWIHPSELSDKDVLFKRRFLNMMSIVDKLPVTLEVSVHGAHIAAPFFGVGEEDFLGNVLRPAKLSSDEFNSALLANGKTSQAVGFFETEARYNDYWIKDGKYYFKFLLSEEQATKADLVEAQLSVGGR